MSTEVRSVAMSEIPCTGADNLSIGTETVNFLIYERLFIRSSLHIAPTPVAPRILKTLKLAYRAYLCSGQWYDGILFRSLEFNDSWRLWQVKSEVLLLLGSLPLPFGSFFIR